MKGKWKQQQRMAGGREGLEDYGYTPPLWVYERVSSSKLVRKGREKGQEGQEGRRDRSVWLSGGLVGAMSGWLVGRLAVGGAPVVCPPRQKARALSMAWEWPRRASGHHGARLLVTAQETFLTRFQLTPVSTSLGHALVFYHSLLLGVSVSVRCGTRHTSGSDASTAWAHDSSQHGTAP